MRIIILMAAYDWVSHATHVYEPSDLESRLARLTGKEAIGWAIPIASSNVHDTNLWVATEEGNGMLKMRPGSRTLTKTCLRLGQTLDGHTAVQFVKRIPADEPVGVWRLGENSDDWSFDSEVRIGETALMGELKRVSINLGSDDIFMAQEMLPHLEALWPSATLSPIDGRLRISCSELAKNNGVAGTIMIGSIPIEIREIEEVNYVRLDSCATKLRLEKLGALAIIVGRSFLGQYDVFLDGGKREIHVLFKSSFSPKFPLIKYRRDFEFVGPTAQSWRWMVAPGPVTKDDFVITSFDSTFPQSFEVIFLFKAGSNFFVPSSKVHWIGVPVVDISPEGVEVSERRDWEKYEIRISGDTQIYQIGFENMGFRMESDRLKNVEGKTLELYPVRGRRTEGEFTVPVWPPIVENGIRIHSIAKIVSDDLLQRKNRWLGKPRFEILNGNRISITADPSDSECDRLIQLSHPSTFDMTIDFSVEICKYRQVNLGAPGYAFEPLKRSSTVMKWIEFQIKGARVIATSEADQLSFHTWSPQGADRWSPDHPWAGAPVATFDPITRMITITPSSTGGWEYSHGWRIASPVEAFLEFKPQAKRLMAIREVSLTDNFWEFVPVTAESEGPQFTIRKDSFMRKEADGSLSLLFEDVSGPLFVEPLEGTFTGIPTVAVLDSGALVMRSKEGFKPTFKVIASCPSPQSLLIRFTPLEYARYGSVEVKMEKMDEICAICHDEINTDETVAKTKCGHLYHLSCLRRIEQRVCPYCRTSLDLS